MCDEGKKTITVIGSLNVDYTTRTSRMPLPGETFRAISFSRGFGGKGANQAVACARLSAPEQGETRSVQVRMCGCIGSDSVGKEMREYLADNGIDVSLVRECDDTTTGSASIIVVDDSGENCILIVGGANDCLTGDEDVVNVDGYHLAVFQLESPMNAVEKHIKKLHESGAQILLNPSPAPSATEHAKLDSLNSILPHVEFLVINVSEAELLSSTKPGTIQTVIDKDIKSSIAHLDRVCSVLFQRGVSHNIITLGSQGIYLKSKSGQISSRGVYFSALKAKVVDTTGAGDTFLGAFAASLASTSSSDKDKKMIEAICYARHAAAMSVEKPGAQSSIPTRSGVSSDNSNTFRNFSEPVVGKDFVPLSSL